MYRVLRRLVVILIHVLFGLKAHGIENLPSGGAVIAPLHRSFMDPVAVAGVIEQPISFMAKKELFRYPVFGWLLSKLHAFPVQRGVADRNAIRRAMDIVQSGGYLGIFPEGTRSRDGRVLPLQGGAALIAIKAGVPVVPVVVTNVAPLRLRRAIEVRIGQPIDLGEGGRTNRTEVKAAGEQISKEFTSLLGRNL